MAGVALWLYSRQTAALSDFVNYRSAGGGEFGYYYYAYWLVPFLTLLQRLPFYLSAALWLMLNIAGLWAAARVMGGNAALALLTYQALYLLYYGQIGGIIAGGLALAWWGMAHRKWGWAGLGLLIAAVKFQSGLLLGAFLWLLAPLTWRERLKALVVPVLGACASVLVYPGWPLQWLQRLQDNPANDYGSISLWPWLGPAVLLLFVPPVLIRLDQPRRFLALAAAACLAVPYFQQADLVNLFILPLGWLAALGNLGFLFIPFGWTALKLLALLPALVYLAAFWPGLRRKLHWEAGE